MKFYVQVTHSRRHYTGSMNQILAYNCSNTPFLLIGPTLPYKSSIEMEFCVQGTHSRTPYTGYIHHCIRGVQRQTSEWIFWAFVFRGRRLSACICLYPSASILMISSGFQDVWTHKQISQIIYHFDRNTFWFVGRYTVHILRHSPRMICRNSVKMCRRDENFIFA